jgi:arginase
MDVYNSVREHSVQRRAGGAHMHVRIIGVPMDLGADRRGVDIGASAIRYAGLNDQLRHLNYEVHDMGNIVVPQPESQPIGNTHLKYLEPILKVSEELADTVTSALVAKEFPLILGGDHSIALGSITGVTRVYKDISVVWIDAHADFNTEESTPSGNIHGMILAALAGIGNSYLTGIGGWVPKLDPQKIVIVGARNLDLGERELLRSHHVNVFTMSDIDQRGISNVMGEALSLAGKARDGIHLSLDMDALDPEHAPGVGTPVPGGLTYREAHMIMELIADSGHLIGMDVVEVNPILDRENATALLAVELIMSALGKKIM